MAPQLRQRLLPFLGAALCIFSLAEVNYPHLTPQSQLAIFSMLGLSACFLLFPAHPSLAAKRLGIVSDWLLVGVTVFCCGFIVVQTEPLFEGLWMAGQSLGHRAGQETTLDKAVGVAGIVLVVEATRRAIGLALPLLATIFLLYAWTGPSLPGWLFPHRGYAIERIVSQAFLHSQGVFGVALRVMFTYVFLFVLLGAFLQKTGATGFIIDIARRLFRKGTGGPAKVAVLSSGMMGSLSGSAVANTATTGTFTIPMMRSAGFAPQVAAGIEAAASTGGALVPPVMGAGAYMMLEIIDPPVTYLQIIRAAMLPALLYYFSLFLIVHFTSRRLGAGSEATAGATGGHTDPDAGGKAEVDVHPFEGIVFGASFLGLILFLLLGYTAFRAVSLALGVGLAASLFSPRTRQGLRGLAVIATKACKDVVPLIAAAACVGIVLGVVTLTGIGTRFPSLLLPLAQESLVLALMLIMVSSIILGMGLPSAVCYLLLATLIGPVLSHLGVVPLAAHLFIFYFGMMSMVTPPVALAAYAAGSIAGTNIMRTGFAAFRFALVGFSLPYMFVFRPELLLLATDGGAAHPWDVIRAVALAVLGIVPFAAAIAGHLFGPASAAQRGVLLVVAALLLFPGPEFSAGGWRLPVLSVAGLVLLAVAAAWNWRERKA